MRFEAELDLSQPSFRCNCSICRRTRFWPAVARDSGFRLLAGEEALTRYRFGPCRNEHCFCRVCGVRTHGIGNDTPIGRMVGVNLGCLEALSDDDLARIPITYVDGLNDRFAPPAQVAHL
ncbi:hypothetical protein ISF6_4216 [Piscinibacter sakaiensis]|uniref:CENP-V/GFA domain-containing protein n=1 Tax=Piscinibacter sakaiensis TaxID=1547922 RepID=A0A0K8P5Y1_PISS1|nr:hypothetical protein ISF6_4216 [Piscinibacter sakaiensis]